MAKTVEVGGTAYDFLRAPYLRDESRRKSMGQQPQTYVQWLAEQIKMNRTRWVSDRYEQARAFKGGC